MLRDMPFKRLLIANRGEIAIRIARAATELGIQTVGIYAYEDRFSLHRYKTDESYRIGSEGAPTAAYLDQEAIIALARKVGIDAIHPGYGFLSENAEFAERCAAAGIVFVGPQVEVLRAFGDKVTARNMAQKAGLRVIPGTVEALKSLEEAREIARGIGYPLTLKAVAGGGGRGIRMISDDRELAQAFATAQSEAKNSFGRQELYLEKTIVEPKHIEIQILADKHGHIVHLFERDCSIQRRHQKVVEVAPAPNLPEETKQQLYQQAVTLAQHVSYQGLGTVEFLVDRSGTPYFLEVNPRIQVEHTVTEMVTGIDLMQASILVAAGYPLDHPLIAIPNQHHLKVQGFAIQCRITTENPLNNFAPETGQLIAYRPAAGFGVRLDEGHGTSGATITPHYDSLLVKLTVLAPTLAAASEKMHRSLAEFRIRGIKHNIPLLKNIVRHQAFLGGTATTRFFDTYPEVFRYHLPKDRATKVLRYIAEVTVNDVHGLKNRPYVGPQGQYKVSWDASVHNSPHGGHQEESARQLWKRLGNDGLKRWLLEQKQLLLTDTTMRDAHQSLFATRLRTRDMLEVAPYYEKYAKNFFSLETWGGATFDVALRFLKEDPWLRLAALREAMPNVLLQMLLRGDNAVGYTNYPTWVVRSFIKESVATGLDVFRIFDCLNQPDKMRVATEEVKKQGAIAELCICYTGDISDPTRTKYDLKYYLKVAKELEAMGADILCIKDMAGLLKPKAAAMLISELRAHINLPLHLHTHDTSGVGVAMLLEAAKAGCHIVDGAVSSMSGLTSQPSLNALVASLQGDHREPQVSLGVLDNLARYWEGVRSMYQAFDPGLKATSTDVYVHEIPGGQYSNFYEQAQKVGLTPSEFYELTIRYKEVNDLMGDIIKVTPSSKVVGDLALLLYKAKITGPELLRDKPKLDYPDSVRSFFQGEMGTPYGGFAPALKEIVLSSAPAAKSSAAVEDNWSSYEEKLSTTWGRSPNSQELLSSRLYPRVFEDYQRHVEKYGDVTSELSTEVFFYGMKQGEEIELDLEPGKTLYVSLNGVSKADSNGRRTVFFNLNGYPREIQVRDQTLGSTDVHRAKGDTRNIKHVAALMPGKVIAVKVKVGDSVAKGDVLFITEAMKMEYAVTARTAGKIAEILVKVQDVLESEDLLAVLE